MDILFLISYYMIVSVFVFDLAKDRVYCGSGEGEFVSVVCKYWSTSIYNFIWHMNFVVL